MTLLTLSVWWIGKTTIITTDSHHTADRDRLEFFKKKKKVQETVGTDTGSARDTPSGLETFEDGISTSTIDATMPKVSSGGPFYCLLP